MAEGKLDHPAVGPKDKALLTYVKILTERPSQLRDTDVDLVRKAGWTDEEIAEAAFITALFAFFNRMSDAYGLEYPRGGYIPPEDRTPAPMAQPMPPATGR